MKKEKKILVVGEIGNLWDLTAGQYARILNINLKNQAVKKRLREMGVIKNIIIEIKNPAPFGEPMQISLMGYRLAIGKTVAQGIEVVVIDKIECYNKTAGQNF